MTMKEKIFVLIIILVAIMVYAKLGRTGEQAQTESSTFDSVYAAATVKDDVAEIRYDQFLKIRESGEDYVLLHVLSAENYAQDHIENAVSFPVNTINRETAEQLLPQNAKIIVYCASFTCPASTDAAKKLSDLGYTVVDYKGGLQEWQEKGNQLAL